MRKLLLLAIFLCHIASNVSAKDSSNVLILFTDDSVTGKKSDYFSLLHSDLFLSGYFVLEERKVPFGTSYGKIKKSLLEEKEKNWDYLGKLTKENGELKCVLFDKLFEKTHYFSLPAHSSQINRTLIHKLSDEILFALFEQRGIAQEKIFYALKEKNKECISEIYFSDYDGENAVQFTSENHFSTCPIGAGKKNLACLYTRLKEGSSKLFYKEMGKKSIPILPLSGNQMLPSLSHNKEYISFISDVAGNPDLFVQKISSDFHLVGKPFQISAKEGVTCASSTFSPDGKKIAFVSDLEKTPRIYFLSLESLPIKNPSALPSVMSQKNKNSVSPSWSPNGEKIAYSGKIDGYYQIWIYDCKLQTERQITFDPVNKENPSFAKNSRHLLYNTEEKDRAEIYLIDTISLRKLRVTNQDGEKRFPSWR